MTKQEAIKVAVEMYGWLKTDREREALETLIPELKESEDERIRKYLIEELKAAKSVGELKFTIPQPTREKCIAYLEKQEIFSKNGAGCYYYNADGSYTFIGSQGFGPIEDIKINGERPKTENNGVDLPCDSLCVEKQKEQKPVEPSDDELQRHQDELYDFKVFAAKQAKEHHISFVHDFEWNNFCAGLLSYFNEQKHAWSEEDEEMFRIITNRIEKFNEWATEQGYPIDDPTMKQSPIAWFKSLPERFNLQPKQEWGEEDERIKRIRKAILANYKGDYHIPTFNGVTREDCIAYLEKEKDNKFAPRVLPCSAAWFEDGEEKQKERNPINHNLTTWHRDVVYCAMRDESLDEGLRCNLEIVYKTIKEIVDRTPVVEEQKPEGVYVDCSEHPEWYGVLPKEQEHAPQPHTVSIKDAEKFGNLEYERGVKDGIQSEKSRQWKPTEEQLRVMEAALRFAQCRGVFREKDIPALESLFYKLKDIYNSKKA